MLQLGPRVKGTHTVTASITSSRGPDTVAYGHQWSALHWLLIASNKQKTLLVSGLIISRPVLIWLPEHFYNAKLGWVDITIFRPTNANDYPSCLELLVIVFIVISTFIQAHTLGNTLKFKSPNIKGLLCNIWGLVNKCSPRVRSSQPKAFFTGAKEDYVDKTETGQKHQLMVTGKTIFSHRW